MTPEESEEAARLLRAAHADLRAVQLLAVEKAIKAVLVASGTELPYTHDLSFLLDVLSQHRIPAPLPIAEADWLTPWAVAARYGASGASLDRHTAATVAIEAVEWATLVVDRG